MKIKLIYTTDPWHTRDSMELIAISTRKNNVLSLIRKFIKKYNYSKLSTDDIYNLTHIRQTQGYEEEFEFYIEEQETNVIL